MIIKIYFIRDDKAESFHTTFHQHNDALASRAFVQLLETDGSMLATAPQDFRLYCVGEFNDQEGTLTAYPQPKFICDLSSQARLNAQKRKELENASNES